MSIPVQRLPKSLLFVFLVLLNMFVPLSMDLYLPALPEMSHQLGGATEWVNLTLTGFFVFYALGALVWGPLSDKHGRRPLLLAMITLYTLASVACAVSGGIAVLILVRCVQGLAAGGISTVAMAVIKDTFSGETRARFLALTQTAGALAPMVAPSLGTWILTFADWRMAFFLLAVTGALALLLALFFSESHRPVDRFTGSLAGAFGRMGQVLKNPKVSLPVLIFALGGLPFLGYISASSYIYIDLFHLSRQEFALFFAGNALCMMAAPLFYARWGTSVNRRVYARVGFTVGLAAGLGLVFFGSLSPWVFLGLFALFAAMNTTMRPFSTNLIFDQHPGDNGAIAAILGTSNMLMGSLGMVLASVPTSNRVVLLGTLVAVCSLASLVGWGLLLRSKVRLVGLEPRGPRPGR